MIIKYNNNIQVSSPLERHSITFQPHFFLMKFWRDKPQKMLPHLWDESKFKCTVWVSMTCYDGRGSCHNAEMPLLNVVSTGGKSWRQSTVPIKWGGTTPSFCLEDAYAKVPKLYTVIYKWHQTLQFPWCKKHSLLCMFLPFMHLYNICLHFHTSNVYTKLEQIFVFLCHIL